MRTADGERTRAPRFVVFMGIMSFFADVAREDSRGILGPYLALLEASGTAVGVVAGFGELAGYGLCLVSGRVSGAGSLVFGRLLDRKGLPMLIPLTLVTTGYVPLAFFGGFTEGVQGAGIWEPGMGVHESIMPAPVAPTVSRDRRVSAYGLFTGVYGLAWFLVSVAIGALYDISIAATTGACLLLVLASVPIFIVPSFAPEERREEVALANPK